MKKGKRGYVSEKKSGRGEKRVEVEKGGKSYDFELVREKEISYFEDVEKRRIYVIVARKKEGDIWQIREIKGKDAILEGGRKECEEGVYILLKDGALYETDKLFEKKIKEKEKLEDWRNR